LLNPRLGWILAPVLLLVGAGLRPPSARGGIPCGVIENPGHLDERALAYASCAGATIYFAAGGVVLDLTEASRVLWLRFEGTEGRSVPRPEGDAGTRVSHFIGSDPSRWRANSPARTRVVYDDLWPGIDLELTPEEEGLRFVIAAGRQEERSRVRFHVDGLDSGPCEFDGNLAWTAPGSNEIRIERFGDRGEAILRWSEDRFDESPGDATPGENPASIIWSTLLGGGDSEYAHGLTLDADDNSLVAGYTRSATFPTTPGAYDRTLGGGYDLFVAKLDASGSALQWATFIGGNAEDRPFAIALDGLGNPVIAGLSLSNDFPTTPGAHDRTLGGSRDGFVCKLNDSGSALLWSSFLGGGSLDRVWDLLLDGAGRAVVVGETYSADFPTTEGAFDRTLDGLTDGFAATLDPSGASLLWSTYLGGSVNDQATFLALDSMGRVVATGNTSSSDFPTTEGAFDRGHNGGDDAFVAALTQDGSAVAYGTFVGGSGSDMGNVVAVDHDDGIVATGSTTSSDFPVTPLAFDRTYNGDRDVFLVRLEEGASRLAWATFLGGDSVDEAFALLLDELNCPVISGEVSSANLPTTADAFDRSYGGGTDAFVSRFDPSGATLLWSSYLGGSDSDGGWELTMDHSGRALLTGPTRSPNFPTTIGAYDQTHNGGRDVFVVRFDAIGPADVDGVVHGRRPALRIWPNPFRGRVEAEWHSSLSVVAGVIVTDLAGRRIATLPAARRSDQTCGLVWDGRDDRGSPAAPGVYMLRLGEGRRAPAAKLTLLR